MTSKQIAGELGISYKTVDAQTDTARTRLGVNSLAEAAQIYGIAAYADLALIGGDREISSLRANLVKRIMNDGRIVVTDDAIAWQIDRDV